MAWRRGPQNEKQQGCIAVSSTHPHQEGASNWQTPSSPRSQHKSKHRKININSKQRAYQHLNKNTILPRRHIAPQDSRGPIPTRRAHVIWINKILPKKANALMLTQMPALPRGAPGDEPPRPLQFMNDLVYAPILPRRAHIFWQAPPSPRNNSKSKLKKQHKYKY